MADELQPTAPVMGDQVAEDAPKENEIPETNSYSKDQVDDLLSALRSERKARKDNEKQLKEMATQLEQLKGIDPEQHAKLQAEAAKRAELEAALKDQIGSIEKTYAAQLAEADASKKKANLQVLELQKRHAFEQALATAGGRGGKWTDTVYAELGGQFKLEEDGTVSVVDKSGAYVLEDGKRIKPEAYLKGFKSDDFLGYAFKPERGAGSGLMDLPGARIGNSQDLHSMSKDELFRSGFGVKKG
jgi:hypothetical protein